MVGGLRCRCHRSVWAEDWQCAPSAVPAHEAAEGAAAAAAVEAAVAVQQILKKMYLVLQEMTILLWALQLRQFMETAETIRL